MAADRTAYKLASWNVNGLRAVMKKTPSFAEIAEELDADVLAIQETKLQEGQVDLDLPGYCQVWSYAERKGYSGTAVFARTSSLGEPLSVLHADALPLDAAGSAAEAAGEGRVCALEFDRFWLVDVYTPNAQDGLKRIDVRMAWDDAYRSFLKNLEAETGKPVVTCGDFNVAHELPLQRAQEQRGLAHRLLFGERVAARRHRRRAHPRRHLRIRPLPRRAGHRAVRAARRLRLQAVLVDDPLDPARPRGVEEGQKRRRRQPVDDVEGNRRCEARDDAR